MIKCKWINFSSVAQSCLTLCNPMDCSIPGFPVIRHCPEFAQTHVHWVSDAIQPSHPLSSPSPPAFNLSQHQDLFPMSRLFTWAGQSIGASVLASVLPMNIQNWLSRIDWFHLLAVQGTLRSLLQHHSSKEPILWHSACFMVQLSHLYMTIGKTIAKELRYYLEEWFSFLFFFFLMYEIPFSPQTKSSMASNTMEVMLFCLKLLISYQAYQDSW